MLRASVRRVEAAVVPAASEAAAVAASASAAPCIVRFVRYQSATSVPSPAKPITIGSASAKSGMTAPRQSAPSLPNRAAIDADFLATGSFVMVDIQLG